LTLTEAQFRKILVAFAVMLGLAGTWTLVSELARTPRVGFAANQNDAASANQRWRVALAARLGIVRGDLWADLFFTFADAIVSRSARDFGAIETLNEALPAARRALLYAPFQSQVWLLLAVMAEDYELQAPSTINALSMSYYTAPSNFSLAALRLSVATRGNAVRDPGLRQLVEQDLQMIFANKPELRPAVLAAYATASTEGRDLIRSLVQETDPAFLMQLQKKTP
jgi:hypothetical protein